MTVFFFVFLIGLVGGYAYLLAKLSTIAAPDYSIPADTHAPPVPSKADRDHALSICSSDERSQILDLYDTLKGNLEAYNQLEGKISKNKYLAFALILPLIPAGDLYLTMSVWLALFYVAAYVFFFWYFRFHTGSASYKAQPIPEVTLPRNSCSTAAEYIKSWNRALSLTGYPLVRNIEAYDKLHKESSTAFVIVLIMSLAPVLLFFKKH